jgi:hypothetical protein
MLATYQADVQDLLADSGAQFYQVATLNRYINRARRRIAAASGCVRVMPKGAQTIAGQEEYKFHDWTALVQAVPGVREILAVRSLAISIGGLGQRGAWKPIWNQVPWTDWQARFGIWNGAWVGTISYPGWWAQYGFGVNGSIFLAPIPSQAQSMELDCSCMPFPLETDDDPECIPQPWCDAVQYHAAFHALLQQQRPADAQALLQLYQAEMPFCASVVAPTFIQSPYGAVVRAS